jgi:hypothetical protein
MQWDEIRQAFPNKWVVVEAMKAHSENDERILDDIAVLYCCGDDGSTAWKRYEDLHAQEPCREYLPLHTSHEVLTIKERHWLGIRPAR